MLTLSTAQSDADFNDVFSFWYDVYVIEMGRHLSDALTSHEHRTLKDPLALAGSLGLARSDGRVVGTILTTAVDHPATAKYRALYDLESLSLEAQRNSVITTKFMVAPGYRRTHLPLRLACAAFEWGLNTGVKDGYIDCNDHLLELFLRLGYKQHLPELYHDEYGHVNSMHMRTNDERHLDSVKSPFLPILKRHQRKHRARARAGEIAA